MNEDGRNTFNNILPKPLLEQRTTRSVSLPFFPSSPTCIGRDTNKTDLIKLILEDRKRSVAILGAGGMGKTTLALAVMHDNKVVSSFPIRYFVDCEGATALELLYTRLADVLRVPPDERDQYIRDRVLEDLHGVSTVLCFDNFESTWEAPKDGSRVEVEKLLRDMSGIVSLSILITMRGAEAPLGVQKSHVLSPPSQADGLAIFEDISERAADEFAERLVE